MFVAGGSFAKVFKVDETTALKRPEAELRNKSTLVIREWLVSRSIDHPNVMCYKKLATNLDITMELADTTLEDQISSHREDLVQLIHQVLNGINAINSAGFVHNDISPKNILLKGESVRLTDFGSSLFKFSARTGCMQYMAPELITEQSVDNGGRSDIWSLGAVIFKCVTGKDLLSSQKWKKNNWAVILDMLKKSPTLIYNSKNATMLQEEWKVYLDAELKPFENIGRNSDLFPLLFDTLVLDVKARATAKELVARYTSDKIQVSATQVTPNSKWTKRTSKCKEPELTAVLAQKLAAVSSAECFDILQWAQTLALCLCGGKLTGDETVLLERIIREISGL